MNAIHKNLKQDGILIWGGPVGKDMLAWNIHRIYGPIRLPLLFKNFEEVEWFGSTKEQLFNKPLVNDAYQPVVVLQKGS